MFLRLFGIANSRKKRQTLGYNRKILLLFGLCALRELNVISCVCVFSLLLCWNYITRCLASVSVSKIKIFPSPFFSFPQLCSTRQRCVHVLSPANKCRFTLLGTVHAFDVSTFVQRTVNTNELNGLSLSLTLASYGFWCVHKENPLSQWNVAK